MLEEESVSCPYCGEPNPIALDPAQGDSEYIEDCTVCCQPILFRIIWEDGEPYVETKRP